MMPQRNQEKAIATAASIWFEIWGVVDPGEKNFDFYRQISEKFQYFQPLLQKNIEFCRQISEKFDIFRQLKISIFKEKIVHLQLPLGKLFKLLRGLGGVVGLTLPLALAAAVRVPYTTSQCSDLGQVVNLSLSVA